MLVEFRHRSWLDEENRAETLSFLESIGAAYVTVDAPKSDTAKNLVPTVPAVTSGTAYVRFHGRNLGTWNKRGGSAAERFDYLYSDEELGEMVPTLNELARPVGAGVRVLQQQLDARRIPRTRSAASRRRRRTRSQLRRLLDVNGIPATGGDVELAPCTCLSVIHGTDARTELFAPAIADAGHALDEWSFALGNAAAAAARLLRRGARLRRRDARRPGRRTIPGCATRRLARSSCSHRSTPVLGVCLGVQLLARAAGAWVGRMPDGPEIGWCDVELTDAGVDDPVLGALPRTFDALQWHHYTYGVPDGRRRARAQRGVHAGVPARRRVLGRAVPSRGDGGAARGLDRRTRTTRRRTRRGCARRRAEKIDALERARPRSLCAAFLARPRACSRALRELALERQLGVAAPLVPRAGVVARVVAGRAQRERRERGARAGVAVRDDLGALGRADERADLLGGKRAARRAEERRRPHALRAGDVPLPRIARAAALARVLLLAADVEERRARGRPSRDASSCRVGSARGFGSSDASRTGSSSTGPSASSPCHAGDAAEQDRDARVPGELRHLRGRHRTDAVAAVDEHEPLVRR